MSTSNFKTFSIIIPAKNKSCYINETISKILELDYADFEIIIVIDKPVNENWPKTKIIVSSGNVGPAEKRNLAAKIAKGEILAFLDDDAYPRKDWLKKAVKHFKNVKIAAVGGPAVTPPNDAILQKVSAAVFESYLGGGGARNRYLSIGRAKEIDDWPTVNLLVRKSAFFEVRGFDSSYWPGEDTKLCLNLINNGYKIIYDPRVVVYHHRRKNLLNHFKQIGNYALHRGFFAKKYPKTSLKLWYFIPSLFVIYLTLLMVSFLLTKNTFLFIYILPLLFYFLGLTIDGALIAFRFKNLLIGILTIPMIFFTHLWYGLRFIWGLATSDLKR